MHKAHSTGKAPAPPLSPRPRFSGGGALSTAEKLRDEGKEY